MYTVWNVGKGDREAVVFLIFLIGSARKGLPTCATKTRIRLPKTAENCLGIFGQSRATRMRVLGTGLRGCLHVKRACMFYMQAASKGATLRLKGWSHPHVGKAAQAPIFTAPCYKQWSGDAVAWRPSVRPSVCPSVTLMDADHIRWARWNFITRLISPMSSLAARKISAI